MLFLNKDLFSKGVKVEKDGGGALCYKGDMSHSVGDVQALMESRASQRGNTHGQNSLVPAGA